MEVVDNVTCVTIFVTMVTTLTTLLHYSYSLLQPGPHPLLVGKIHLMFMCSCAPDYNQPTTNN